jgi:hypothetical protein
VTRSDAPTGATRSDRITKADIEEKLRELRGEVDHRVEGARVAGAAVAAGLVVTAVVVAYWMGRRRSRKRRTVLEIRRI